MVQMHIISERLTNGFYRFKPNMADKMWHDEPPDKTCVLWAKKDDKVWIEDVMIWDGGLYGRLGWLDDDVYKDVQWGDEVVPNYD